MAATDQTFRNQKTLHTVFAVSSVAMLLSTGWMFWDDYNRPFKKEQRVFRDVEEEIAKRALLAGAPSEEQRKAVVAAEQAVQQAKAVRKQVRDQADAAVKSLLPGQSKLETQYANLKADFDSVTSFFNIAVEHQADTDAASHRAEMDRIKGQMDALKTRVEEGQAEIETVQRTRFPVTIPGAEFPDGLTPIEADERLSQAEDAHKKLTDEFDRYLKLAEQKRWGFGDWFRSLPIIDGFASPTRIQQYTLDELPIDYSFKYVTRYDRCTTCHLGMEKANYSEAVVRRLRDNPGEQPELQGDLARAILTLTDRQRAKDGKPPLTEEEITQIKDQVSKGNYGDYKHLAPKAVGDLTDPRARMFAAHPRLDLFVDSNSPHPAEKFGCTSCHSGQGSATAFVDATHSPNDTVAQARWKKDHDWKSIHFWDFPMHPQRFTESGCLKCHHEVTDLIREGSRDEAPKLTKGYSLVRELGCFGCHEIHGMKAGRAVGPDLRLEPEPALDTLSAAEKAKRLADPANPPGSMRKVGPSLARLSEKTHPEWVRQWIKAPRSFRPDTRMPHYYLQPNNKPEALPEEQKKFPDTEVHAITHYLLTMSGNLVREAGERAKDDEDARSADQKQIDELSAKLGDTATPEKDKRDMMRKLDQARFRMAARNLGRPVEQAAPLAAPPADEKARGEQLERGRHLFSTKGCLACHKHGGTEQEVKAEGKPPLPSIAGESNFGPNLSRLVSKLGTRKGDLASARRWLVQWVLNPTSHNPRTLMPTVQITDAEADDIAAWLLAQPSDYAGVPVDEVDTATLKAMARVYLEKFMTRRQITDVLEDGKGFSDADLVSRPADADENLLAGAIDNNKLLMYVGKKAITNLGCYGCHTIPGFESAKPIGTALNEWGKKDAERIAFEDSAEFVRDHFNIVDHRRELTDEEKRANEARPEGKRFHGWEMKEGKQPYERYFYDQLSHHHHTRDGFLHLKLQEPRSYDYRRVRAWDERARMPQFKFARPMRQPGESDEAFELRATKEEAEAREAVMTFVLGLVAEPVPAKYVHAPAADRLAEIKGRHVLEKFNCAGCHLIRPGTADFKLTPDKLGDKTMRDVVLSKLQERYEAVGTDPSDYRYPEHSAWGGLSQKRKDLIRAHGVTYAEGKFVNDDGDKYGPDEKNLMFRLTQALRFTNPAGEARDLPAASDLLMPRETVAGMTEAYGGRFATLLAQYLQQRDPENYSKDKGKENYSYAAAPPPLIREGEKVQPSWLFQFLRNPSAIRPLTVLRMPKFNMSEEDARALVDYFTAVDKVNNPGIGLTYPYLAVSEKDEDYLLDKTREYVERLKKVGKYDDRIKELRPIWEQITRDQIEDGEGRLKSAKARAEEAKKKNEGAEEAQKSADAVDAELKKLRQALDTGEFKDLKERWETREAYVADAYRLVANGNLCLTCHQVGTMEAKQKSGPPLELSTQRLRPEWMAKWISNPQRFLHYTSVMPPNFKANAKEHEGEFTGSEKEFSLDQIKATRDLMMVYPQVINWPLLQHRPGPGAPGGK